MVLEWIRIIWLLLCWQRDACEYLCVGGGRGETEGGTRERDRLYATGTHVCVRARAHE